MKKLLLLFIGLLFWTGSSWGQTLSESFEDQNNFPPNGWEVIYGDNNPDINTVNQSGSEHYGQGLFSFEFRSYTETNPYDQYLITPKLLVKNGDQTFSFWYKRGSYSDETFRIGWSSTGKALTDFTWSDDVTNANNVWQRHLKTGLPVETKYVVIHYKSVNKHNLFVDAVFGPALYPSIPPNPARYANPSDNATEVPATASLNWQSNNIGEVTTGYKLYFGTNNPPTNLENGVDLGDIITYDPVGDLALNTTYYWSVVPYNPMGDAYYCPVWSFSTMSDPTISTFPYTQAFEGAVPPIGWQEERTPTSSDKGWESSNSGLSGKCARFDSYNNSSDNISKLITTTFNLSALSSAQLRFNYKNPTGGDFSVLLSTDGGLSYPHTLFTGLTAQADWTEKAADILAYIGSNVKIAFRGTSNYGNGDAYIYLDDITIEAVPTCPAPTALTAVNIAAHSADLGWTEKGTATNWQIEYKAVADFTPGTGVAQSIEVTSNPFTITGLEENTTYYWYVKAVCDVDDESYWAGPGTFTTEFAPKTTPYFEGFEVGNIDNEAIGNQWVQEGISGYSVWRANNTDANFNRTPRTGGWNALLQFTNQRWMFQSVWLEAGQEYTFDMYANHFSDGPAPASLTVKYGLSSSSTAMTETIVAKTSTLTNDYQLITGTFMPTETRSYSIGIFGEATPDNYNICIDDIAIYETPACPAPLYLNETDVTLVSAKLGWTERGSASNYNVVWGEAGFDFENGTVISNLSANFALLSGLTANTAYEWYVQANCNDGFSTWVGPKSFSTKRIAPLPYFQGFTSDLTPEGWETTDWEIGEVTYNHAIPPIDGNYIYAILSGTIEARSLTTINMGPATNDMYLTFDYSHARYSNGSGRGSFTVSISTDYGQTYTILETIENTNTSAWQFKTIALNGYQGQDIKIKITANRVKNLNYPYNFAIDNFSIISCPAPSALTASNIKGNSADLGWTENGGATSWNIKYGAEGFNPATEGKLFTGITENPYTLSALLRETTYDWYVQAACNGGGESFWAGPHTFTTLFSPMTTPFFEGFEHGHSHADAVAYGWTQQSVQGINNWTANNKITDHSRSPRSGSWNAYLYKDNQQWMFQKLDLEGGKSYTFDMYARTHEASSNSFVTITVKYGSENNAASMEHQILAGTIYRGNYQFFTGTFTPESSGIYAIGILGDVNNIFTYLSIDDIAIYETPDCHAPFESFVSNIIGTNVDLSWSARGTETSWNIKYGPVGFNPANAAEGTLVSGVNTNPYTLNGLTGKTQYDYYVQAACSEVSQSAWTGPTSFSTGNEYYTIPYVEGFETGHTHMQPIANDWSQEIVAGYNKILSIGQLFDSGKPRTGNWHAFLVENRSWMFQRVMLEANTDYTFELYAWQYTSQTSNASIKLSYGTASNAAAMTNEIAATTTIVNGDYQLVTGNFRPETAGIYSIGIFASTFHNYLSIDDIAIYETLACPAPHALTVSAITPSSATLGWTERGEASNWNIKYGVAGFNPANAEEGALISGVTSNTYVLSGLQANTAYDWYVQATCAADETSTWTGPKTFTTAHLASAPYTQEFTTTSTPEGWTISNWFVQTTSQMPVLDGNYIISNSWTNSLKTFETINIGPVSTDMMLSFYYNHIKDEEPEVSPGVGSGGFEFSISTDYGATYSVLETVNNNASVDWQYKEISLSAYAGKILKIKVTGIYNTGYFLLALDNISISVPVICPAPLSLATSNITATTAELGWTEYHSADTYNIKYGVTGFNPANAEESTLILGVTSNPYVLSGLQANTAYDWYVQAACSASDASTWTGPQSFTTDCGSTSIPYFESFDAVIAPALPRCMSEIDANGDGKKWITDDYYAYSKPNAAFISYNNSIPMNDWLFTQGLMLEAGKTYEVGFAYGSKLEYQEKLAVQWGNAATVEGMTEVLFSNLETIGNVWHTTSATLTPTTAGIYYIGFKGQSDADKYELYLDDIYVVEQVATAIWTGAINSNWNNTGNWSTGVPSSITDVIIPAGLANYPTISGAARCNNILLQSNANGTASLLGDTLLSVNGSATIQRYINGGGYHFVSVPIAGTPTAGLFMNSYLYDYDAGSQAWTTVGEEPSTVISNEQGYMIWYTGSTTTYDFSGSLISGAFTPTTPSSAAPYQYSLVPNPYPSAIDWDAAAGWTKTNLNGAIYIWNRAKAIEGNPNGQYASYIGGTSTNSGSQFIPVGQSFFVETDGGGTPALAMNNKVRVHSNQTFLKSTQQLPDLLRIKATTENGDDEMVVRVLEDATHEFDRAYDASKLFGSETLPQLYSLTSDERMLSINSIALEDGTAVVPVGFEWPNSGEVSINFTELESFDPNIAIFLEDVLSGKMIDVREQQIYAFTHTEGNEALRFKLHFKSVVGVDEQLLSAHQIWSYDSKVYVSIPALTGEKALIQLIDVQGKVVYQGEHHLNNPEIIYVRSNQQLLIARIITGTQVYIQKVFIR